MLWLAVGCPVASVGAAAGGPCEGASRVEDDAAALVFALVPGAGAWLLAGVASEGRPVVVGGLLLFQLVLRVVRDLRGKQAFCARHGCFCFFPFVLFLMRVSRANHR
jgi:hypothetical protein